MKKFLLTGRTYGLWAFCEPFFKDFHIRSHLFLCAAFLCRGHTNTLLFPAAERILFFLLAGIRYALFALLVYMLSITRIFLLERTWLAKFSSSFCK